MPKPRGFKKEFYAVRTTVVDDAENGELAYAAIPCAKYCDLFGYHTSDCIHQSWEDAQKERGQEIGLNIALGK